VLAAVSSFPPVTLLVSLRIMFPASGPGFFLSCLILRLCQKALCSCSSLAAGFSLPELFRRVQGVVRKAFLGSSPSLRSLQSSPPPPIAFPIRLLLHGWVSALLPDQMLHCFFAFRIQGRWGPPLLLFRKKQRLFLSLRTPTHVCAPF